MTQNNGPQIGPTYEYVTLHGKRSFVDVIVVKDLTTGRLFWIVQVGYNAVIQAIKTGRRWEENGSEGWDGRRKRRGQSVSGTWPTISGFKDGGDGHEPRGVGGLEKLGMVLIWQPKRRWGSQSCNSGNWILSTTPANKERELPLQLPERNTALSVSWV